MVQILDGTLGDRMTNAEPKIFFTWDIQYECNYNCAYCFLHNEKETTNIKTRILGVREWVKIWENILERYGKAHISVTGGEPFSYPNFIELLSELTRYHTFEFSTNFSLDAGPFMAKIKNNTVRINPSFHPEYPSVEEFLSKYLLLRDAGYSMGVVTIVGYPPMLDKIGEYKKVFEAHNIGVVIFPFRGPHAGGTYPDAYTREERGLLKKLGAGISSGINEEINQKYNIDGKAESDRDKPCFMGTRYAKIVPNGDAFRCCAAVWTPEKTWESWGHIGNIIDGTFSFEKEPQPCKTKGECRCFKAMVSGKEESWKRHWTGLL